jgi:drug/metabolite transporter (DMT)-like permease
MAISDNFRGALYMNVAMAAFTLNDTAMKAATLTMPLFEAIALRGLITTIGLIVLGLTIGGLHLRIPAKDRTVVWVRSLAEIGGTVLFLTALMHMPLANLSAIMQALPLAVTLAAAVIFRETIGWRRLTSILIGFTGVLIIIRPGPDGFDVWSLMGLGAVLCVVVRDLSTRRLSSTTPSVTVAVWASGSVMVVGILGAFVDGWHGVSLGEGMIVASASLALLVGYMFSIMVMRVGDIGFVAPFRYTALLWAILLGWLSFGTLPDRVTVLGAAIVVTSGIYLLLRERKLRMAARIAS